MGEGVKERHLHTSLFKQYRRHICNMQGSKGVKVTLKTPKFPEKIIKWNPVEFHF
jgi:hypothetical protein